jgi:hypothetical protein
MVKASVPISRVGEMVWSQMHYLNSTCVYMRSIQWILLSVNSAAIHHKRSIVVREAGSRWSSLLVMLIPSHADLLMNEVKTSDLSFVGLHLTKGVKLWLTIYLLLLINQSLSPFAGVRWLNSIALINRCIIDAYVTEIYCYENTQNTQMSR